MKIIHFYQETGRTRDGDLTLIQRRNAVVIARDVKDGYYQLKIHSPMGSDWSDAKYFHICECRNSLTPRVLSMEL